MSYLKEIEWIVLPLTMPTVTKNCSKCGQNVTFINSKKFRVNANKQKIDVWLIYQCKRCKTTWNMSIYERIAPKDIAVEAYQSFLENDLDMVWHYAFDKALHMKHKVMLEYEQLDYQVVGESVLCLSETNEPYDELEIKLICHQPFDLRLDKLLSHKLGVSRSQVKKLCHNGIISDVDGNTILKEKIRDDLILRVKVKK